MFKHYLNFKNGYPNRIEITEPAQFDGLSFTVKQDEGRFGRDVSYAAEEMPLVFFEGIQGEPTSQVLQLPNSIYVNRLTSGYEWLLEYDTRYGTEADVEYIVERDGTDFIIGDLDFENREHKFDGARNLEFTVVQNAEKLKIKRFEETSIDLFSDKDLEGNTITPADKESVYLKAKPFFGVSTWKSISVHEDGYLTMSRTASVGLPGYIDFQEQAATNNCLAVTGQGIKNTLSFLSTRYVANNGGVPLDENFSYLYAQNELSNVKIKLTDIVAGTQQAILRTPGAIDITDGSAVTKFVVRIGRNIDDEFAEYVLYSRSFEFVDSTLYAPFPTSFELTIPFIPQGHRLYIYSTTTGSATFTGTNSGSATYLVDNNFENMNVEISATQTGIDSVIKGVRLIDTIAHPVKSINGFATIAPRYQSGGSFWNNIATTGKGLRGFEEPNFTITLKEAFKELSELCADYQTNDDNVFITQYDGFYPNREIAVFDSIPANTFQDFYNSRYTLVNFNYKYASFEQDRDEKNTTDSVHTERQYKTPYIKANGAKDVEVPFRRDPNGIESDRSQNISVKETTSLAGDDKVSAIDVISLPAGTKGTLSLVLLMRVISGTLQILNNDTAGNGIGFTWKTQGFEVGDDFDIVDGQNIGSYTVTTIENTVLTLTPKVGTTPSFSGDGYISAEFDLSGVSLVNRTNEGFTIIDGTLNPDNYGNLLYTPVRNISEHWKWYLAACIMYKPTLDIKNTYVKSNGELRTQFGSGKICKENQDILASDLPNPLITPKKYKLKVQASLQDVVDLLANIQDINGDEIGGFIRAIDADNVVIKGYISSLKYLLSTEELDLEIEEKYEPNQLSLTTALGAGSKTININGLQYDIATYEIKLGKFEIFDSNYRMISNKYYFTDVKINGVLYNNEASFTNALNLIL